MKFANDHMWPEAGDTGTIYLLVYMGGPMLGAFIAAIWHKWIQEESYQVAYECTDPEYEELLAQGHYKRKTNPLLRARDLSQKM